MMRPGRLNPRVRSALFAALALGVITSACGGNDSDPPSNDPPPADPIRIRGTERLQWSQAGPSAARVRQYQYRLYIDQSGQVLNGVQCGESQGSAGFDCSALLPGVPNGAHTLSVSATENGVEGARSTPLNVMVDSSRQVTEETLSIDRGRQAAACLEDGGVPQCFAIRALAMLENPVASVATLPDGRLAFVEGTNKIRLIADGHLLAEPALVAGADEQLIAVLPDVRFEETRAISVAAITHQENGVRSLTVTQYRELANRLAQGAATLDVPMGSQEQALVDRDTSGRIYVALANQLFRFSSTGTVPWDSGQISPVLAPLSFAPTAMTIDGVGGLAWIAGRADSDDGLLGSISTYAPARSAAQVMLASGPASAIVTTRSPQLISMTFAGSANNRRLFAVDAEGVLRQTRSPQSFSAGTLAPLSLATGPIASVWPGFDNTVIVVSREGMMWSVASLEPLAR